MLAGFLTTKVTGPMLPLPPSTCATAGFASEGGGGAEGGEGAQPNPPPAANDPNDPGAAAGGSCVEVADPNPNAALDGTEWPPNEKPLALARPLDSIC